MALLFLIWPLFMGVSHAAQPAQYSLETLLRLKCAALPYRTVFSKMTCYTMVPETTSCKDILFPYATIGKPSASSLLKKHGLLAEKNSQICAFKLAEDCDKGEAVGDKCVHISKKIASFVTASKQCEKMGFHLFVPHSDADLQEMLEITSTSPARYFWIGSGNMGEKWRFHDGSEVDFFRLRPNRAFCADDLGMVFLARSKENDSYVGYTTTKCAEMKFFFVCSRPLLAEYRIKNCCAVQYQRKTTLPPTTSANPETTTTTTTTTSTTTTTKGRRPFGPKVNVIRRFWNGVIWMHHYFLDSNLGPWDRTYGKIIPTGVESKTAYYGKEADVGFVISAPWMDQIDCDKKYLVEMARWQRTNYGQNPVSLFAPINATLSKSWEQIETFVCVTQRGRCGANWELILYPEAPYDKEETRDLFYPSFQLQKDIMDRGLAKWSRDGQHICYIWDKERDLPYISSN